MGFKGDGVLCPPERGNYSSYKNFDKFKDILKKENGDIYSTNNLKI